MILQPGCSSAHCGKSGITFVEHERISISSDSGMRKVLQAEVSLKIHAELIREIIAILVAAFGSLAQKLNIEIHQRTSLRTSIQ